MKKVLLAAVSFLGMSVAAMAADTQSTTENQTLKVDGVTSATYPTTPTILDQLIPENACQARCLYEYEACSKWAPPWTDCEYYVERCLRNCASK
ncbi:hypothetical protein [Pseudoalteromonas luteoviolacea]|uniref:ShKT domain-containing protein n=1 Tax=Pseudoalteromonas luteoviolacea S4054 TaxID=1129367 RepID=A0A0F6A9N3_9GAMM|nr:hypothetical protein [Pseudoalteromonas luteoviolacea]AOT10851.1 hypothetical protein S4054249_23685 [Pseudoalteromonas luteoviolacea]AOT15987.1 hypothetical protein S40542_24825 [Pseudoalteromonas luteoviolacea]AOT20672.1 hypothetical protein S4054_23605 [Pseudoalteromonas luteoviolacea]KKE82902.1 hypothetical protein N479_16650 [Pseudoalteromonas luteoviolacea S4054]KZN75217.1 hypothetical protein N481_07835 [Pseudoalteromonas luteoviolacea S4047-1]